MSSSITASKNELAASLRNLQGFNLISIGESNGKECIRVYVEGQSSEAGKFIFQRCPKGKFGEIPVEIIPGGRFKAL